MDIQNGKYYSLGSRVFWLFVLRRSVLSLFLLIGVVLLVGLRLFFAVQISGISKNINLLFWLSFGAASLSILAIVAELIGMIAAKLQYRVTKIMLDSYSLKITRGILNKEEVEIPYRRIESVAVWQPFIYRLMKIGKLVVTLTADLLPGEGGSQREIDDAVIPLMDFNLTQAVADSLTQRAQVQRMQIQQGDITQN